MLLIDLENTTGSIPKRRYERFLARVIAIRDAAGRLHHCVAAFGLRGADDRMPLSLLAQNGVAPMPVKPGKNAAEYALLEHAQEVHRRGGRTFVVASADHRFSALADLGRLEVIAWKRMDVAKSLEEAAQVVRRIHKPTAKPTAAHLGRRRR